MTLLGKPQGRQSCPQSFSNRHAVCRHVSKSKTPGSDSVRMSRRRGRPFDRTNPMLRAPGDLHAGEGGSKQGRAGTNRLKSDGGG